MMLVLFQYQNIFDNIDDLVDIELIGDSKYTIQNFYLVVDVDKSFTFTQTCNGNKLCSK